MASLQELSDCGLNPFAAKLLVESWDKHPNKKRVTFELMGCVITLESIDEYRERMQAPAEQR